MSRKVEEKANTNGHDTGQIKVRVIEFELNGRNATLAEGIKAVTAAISNRAVVVQEPGRPALPAPKPKSSAKVLEADEIEQPDVAAAEVEEVREAATDTTNGNVAPKTRKKSVPRAPVLLSDLALGNAQVSLEKFAGEKNPTDTLDKYVVVATWFKEQMQLDEITADHIFTAFRILDWTIPDDPGQPLRDLKSKKQFFDKGDAVGGYKVNFLGTNYVAKMGASQS
jgi:hypothetical protein